MTSEHDRSAPQNDQPAVHPAATDLITLLVRTHLRHAQDAKRTGAPDPQLDPHREQLTPKTNNMEAQPDA